jgi:hypothetical protein
MSIGVDTDYESYILLQQKVSNIKDTIKYIENTDENLVSSLKSIVARFEDKANKVRNVRIEKLTNDKASIYYKLTDNDQMHNYHLSFLHNGEIQDYHYSNGIQSSRKFDIIKINVSFSAYLDYNGYNLSAGIDLYDDNQKEIEAEPDINGNKWYLIEVTDCYTHTKINKIIVLDPLDGQILINKLMKLDSSP